MKNGVSQKILDLTRVYTQHFLFEAKHEPRVLNIFLDYCCQKFDTLDARNHLIFLEFLNRQPELYRIHREMLFRYLSLILSQTTYNQGEESMSEYLRDLVAKIFNTKRLDGALTSLNDGILADFTTILDYLPV